MTFIIRDLLEPPHADLAQADLAGAAPPHLQNAFTLLQADYHAIVELLREAREPRVGLRRKSILVAEICRALALQGAIEDEIFYPAARRVLGVDAFLDIAQLEHKSIGVLIATLEGTTPEDAFFDSNLVVLEEYVRHHVDEEQNKIFPRLRRSEFDASEIGARLAARKAVLLAGRKSLS